MMLQTPPPLLSRQTLARYALGALLLGLGVVGLAPVTDAAAQAQPVAAPRNAPLVPFPSSGGFAAGAAEGVDTSKSKAAGAASVGKPADPAGATVAAVVRLEAQAPGEAPSSATLGRQRLGSGVVIDSRTVLTIGYLVLETDAVDIVTQGGRRIPASLAGYDHQTGFGLVRAALPLDVQALELGDSDAAVERTRVLTLGQGESELTELVVVSRKPFVASWEYLLDRPIFTFPPVNNWSGAALFTEDGKLIGIGSLVVNDAASDRAGVPGNLYVPVNLLKPILADLQARGRRSRDAQPWLGMNTEMVRGHLMVTRVQRGGPAASAGISPGDIVLGVGGDRVRDQTEFYRRVFGGGPAGTEVAIRLLQAGEIREPRVKTIDRADFLTRARGI